MASNNTTTTTSSFSSFSSFTITQPFLGAPLQFQPALGSKQLDVLVDAFVTGPANKQDKLSQVTIDFFNHATVDLLTGALVRRYDVVLPNAHEQSPYDSQSPGFSPPIFTPSPSSSANFADSLRGSISTPPARANRITKKARKETKKLAEAKIPGFQIMTRDGVDVTSSAGRGTKTKEQREHAHLMRIMKACDACKKKKIRCDPSHRRSHTEMSRTSTKTSSSSLSNQSPAASTPSLSLSRETTHTSSGSIPSYRTNPIDDFVLFPEDTASWNSADMSLPGFDQNYDLSQFNFDISDADNGMSDLDQVFDFSSFEQPGIQQPSYPLYNTDHYDGVQWDNALASQIEGHVKPHQYDSSQDSGNLDASWYSSINDGLEFNDSPLSGVSLDSSRHSSRLNSTPQTPALQDISNVEDPGISFAAMDWSTDGRSPVTNRDEDGEASSRGNQPFRRALVNAGDNQTPRLSEAAIQRLLDAVPSYSSESGTFVNSSDQQVNSTEGLLGNPLLDSNLGVTSRSRLDKIHRDINRTSAMLTVSLEEIKSAPQGYEALSSDLLQLQNALDNMKSANLESIVQGPLLSVMQTLSTQLQGVFTRLQLISPTSDRAMHQRYSRLDPEVSPHLLRQCSINARSLAKALCAVTDQLHTQNSVLTDQWSSTDGRTTEVQLCSGKPNSDESRVPQDASLSTLTVSTRADEESRSSRSSIQPPEYSTPVVTTRNPGGTYLEKSFHEYEPVLGSIGIDPNGYTTDALCKIPPSIFVMNTICQDGLSDSFNALSQLSSSIWPSRSVSSAVTYSSSSNVDGQRGSTQQGSQQLQRSSPEAPLNVQTTANLVMSTSQLTSTQPIQTLQPLQPLQSSPDLSSSRSIESFTNPSLSHGGEYAWGAIPQMEREKRVQSSDTTDNVKLTLQTLEAGSINKRLFSVGAMSLCVVSLVVTLLQASPLIVAYTRSLLILSDIVHNVLSDNQSVVERFILVGTLLALSTVWQFAKHQSWSTTLHSHPITSTTHIKFRPVFEFSNTWSALQNNMRRIAGHGHSSTWLTASTIH